VKCLIEVYINFTSEFDRGPGPLISFNPWQLRALEKGWAPMQQFWLSMQNLLLL